MVISQSVVPTSQNGTSSLIPLDQLKRDIQAARSIGDISTLRDIRDKAEALRQFGKKHKWLLEDQNDAAEATVRCSRAMGEILQEMSKHPGNRGNLITSDNEVTGGRTVRPPVTSDNEVKLEELGITKSDSSRCQSIAKIPQERFEQRIGEVKKKRGELTQGLFLKEAKQQKLEVGKQGQEELRRQRYADAVRNSEHCKIYHCSVAQLSEHVEPESIDCIITDPPYPYRFLDVYSDLAQFADYALKPGSSLVVMTGQSYLPEVMQRLASTGLKYQWICAYLTPGGQAPQMWERNVNTFWKPLLWFVKGDYTGPWIGDVCKSAVNNNDKRFHEWGQSESGMADIIGRFTKTDQLICDPFVGGGTTAIVTMEMERRFVGCDINDEFVKTTLGRVSEVCYDSV